MTDAAEGSVKWMTDADMRLARLKMWVKVECKEHGLLGYEPNRGVAWIVFAQHIRDHHRTSHEA